MEIRSLNEIKTILSKFKNAGGVGFAIAPELLKIAAQVGLLGYQEALTRWSIGAVLSQTTDVKEASQMVNGLVVTWEGASLVLDSRNNIRIGLKRTIEDIELLIK